MTRRVLTFSAIAAAVLSVLSAQALAAGAAKEPARVQYSEAGQALAWLGADAPQAALNKLLAAQGANARTLATLQLEASRPGRNGVVHYRFSQAVGGLPVHGAYAQMSVAGDGRIVHLIDRVARVPAALPGASKIDAARALQLAVAHLHPGVATSLKVVAQEGATTRFEGGSFFYEAPRVSPVVVGMDDGSMARAWLVSTWSDKKNLLNHTVVGGDGKVLVVQPLTASDQYNVFLVDPGKGTQTIVNGPGAGNAESPAGWLSPKIQKTTNISGNNVSAYLDTDANNSPDKGGKFVRKQQFLTAVDLGSQPSTTGNKAVAVQNLFYLNNVVHDILYKHGFTEVVGNFQIDNFGKGGKGNDPVKAEAQDGSGTNNANFATPPDGTSPRMQMFLWSPAIPPQEVVVNSPVSARFDAYSAGFGPGLDGTGLSGAIVNTTPADGCTAIGNNVSGAIALIDRGSCNFTVKVKNAQNAGAAAAIIANNQGGNTFVVMGGTDDTITIPSVSVTQNDGATLHAMAAPTGIVRSKTPAPPNIDGDLDSGVVYHEYGHGLTYRMIGNMSGPLAGALGEGASDVNAFMINNDPVLGTYAASNPLGIRRYSYDGYPLTYANVNGAEVHNDGEIYAAAMWRVKELFGDNRREALYSTWVDGMNYTPSQPTFEQMRDGLLQAVSVGPTPGDLCTVWTAFAQFGIGVGSSAVINPDGSVTTSPSFAVPQQCIALRAGGR